MDHQFIHPDGSQDQPNFQHRSCYRISYLATKSIWSVYLRNECIHLISDFSPTKKNYEP